MGCNLIPALPAWLDDPLFQYPESDRMGCNKAAIPDIQRGVDTFSILNRIEWVVTVQEP